MSAELARVGGPVGATGLAVLLAAPWRSARIAGLGVWGAGAALLVPYLAPNGHVKVLAAAGLVGLLVAAGLAALFLRWPWLLPFAILACVPARIPVSVGSTDANLLIPLYAVAAAAALMLAYELLRGDDRALELGPVAWPLAAFVAWSGLTLAWTVDLRQGAIGMLFFYLPFGLLAVAVSRLPWSRRWVQVLYAELVLMALAFAVIGVYQWATRDVFWNPKVIVGNAYAPFYRVNSVFWDPSIYGRFLVVAILASLVIVLYNGRRRLAFAAGAAVCATWLGLLFSFSQSSFVALIAGVMAIAAVAWRWRAAAALGLVAAVLLSVGFSAPKVRHALFKQSSAGLNNASSDRLKLVSNGVRIAVHHAGAGVGIGGFKRAYADRVGLKGKDPKSAASHDTPVTVAAETGVLGLLLLIWLGVASVLLFRRIPRSFEGRALLAFGVALGAIAVHSLFYNALFEDPTAWALLGLGAVGARFVAREETS